MSSAETTASPSSHEMQQSINSVITRSNQRNSGQQPQLCAHQMRMVAVWLIVMMDLLGKRGKVRRAKKIASIFKFIRRNPRNVGVRRWNRASCSGLRWGARCSPGQRGTDIAFGFVIDRCSGRESFRNRYDELCGEFRNSGD